MRAYLQICILVAMPAMYFPVFARGASEASRQHDAAIMARVFEDWRARQTMCNRVYYLAEGTRTVPAGAWTDFAQAVTEHRFDHPVPERDHTNRVTLKLYLDFERNWARKEKLAPVLPDLAKYEMARDFTIYLCDGAQLQSYAPKHLNPGLANNSQTPDFPYELFQMQENAPFFETSDLPLLVAHGMAFGVRPQALRDTGLEKLPQLKVYGTGWIRNRKHYILRSASLTRSARPVGYVEFWVDLERQSAVSRFRQVTDGVVSRAFDIEYQEARIGWIPVKWLSVEFQGKDGRVFESLDFQVTDADPNPELEESMFRVAPSKGMVVQDDIARRVVVSGGPGGVDVDLVIAAGQNAHVRSSRWLWIGGSVAVALVIAFIVARRRRLCL